MNDADSLPEPLREHLGAARFAGAAPEGQDFATGRGENPACGDVVLIHVRRGPGPLVARYQATGCAAVLAVAAFLTDRIEGLEREAARDFDLESAVESLGGLPRPRRHAVSVCRRALLGALDG